MTQIEFPSEYFFADHRSVQLFAFLKEEIVSANRRTPCRISLSLYAAYPKSSAGRW
jgi:hypothetical protein